MVTAIQCIDKYGLPEDENNMILWDVPAKLEVGIIPKRLYCNKDMVEPLSKAFQALITTGAVVELRTFDGCFNIRKKRTNNTYSLHSWGIAIDLNSWHNELGKTYEQLIKEGRRPFSDQFLQCFRDAGFDCGGDWKYPDRMHFQLRSI